MMFVVTLERVSALLLVIVNIQIHLALDQLMVLSECVCPGRELRLECTVMGLGSTVWRGTAFDCPGRGNNILLRHTQFESGVIGECNNGMIIGRSHNRTFDGPNSKFTSQLIIHLPSVNATNNCNTLEGRTIECIYDNGTTATVTATHTIAYMRDAPPPESIHLDQVSKNALTFQWDPVWSVCPDIGYKVNAMNCGMCPDVVFNTSLICYVSSVFTSNCSVCTLSVETTVCESNSGNKSDTVTAMLKAPGPPIISSVLPYYYSGSRELIKVDIEVKSDSIGRYICNISDGIDGSITSYTFNISFLDSDTAGCSSSLATLPASSCVAGVCTITLANLTSLSCYMHPSQIEIAVYASTVLTDGLPSTTSLNSSNNLFFVEYKPLSHSFSCRFVGYYENKSCEITYGAMDPKDQTCYLDKEVSHMNSSVDIMLDTVTVHIPSLVQANLNLFCFKAVGATSMFTVVVEGTFAIGTSPNSNTNSNLAVTLIILLLCVTIILILLVLIAVLSVVLIRKTQCSLCQAKHEQQYCEVSMSFTQPQIRQPTTDQQMIYCEVTPLNANGNNISLVLRDDDKVEYAELNHQHSRASNPMKTPTTHLVIPEANIFKVVDDYLTLDSLLIQLRPQVAPLWYNFGLALGISKDTLNTYVGYPDEECTVEVLDNWLRNCKGKPTWRDVAKALKKVELYQLADGILNVYKTGELPVEVDMEALPRELLDPELDTESVQESPPPLPPK